jgi:hypothetical protein
MKEMRASRHTRKEEKAIFIASRIITRLEDDGMGIGREAAKGSAATDGK